MFRWYVLLQCVFQLANVTTCLVITRALLANSACAVNLLEESGTLVSHGSVSIQV